jgi:hypothetical protein
MRADAHRPTMFRRLQELVGWKIILSYVLRAGVAAACIKKEELSGVLSRCKRVTRGEFGMGSWHGLLA